MNAVDRAASRVPITSALRSRCEPITLATWRDPRNTVRSFRSTRQFIPSARIRGARRASPFERDHRDLSRMIVDTSGATLTDYLERTRASALVVVRDGVLVHEQYLQGAMADDVHLTWSVSKSIVSTIAGILIGDSCFAVTDRVADLVPELAGSAWEGVSVQDLLDMRVGLAWSEDAGSPDVVPYDHAYQWADSAEGPVSALEYLSRIPRGVGPGGAFAYQSVATDVLAWIIESRTGSRLHDVLSRRLWAPLGAADAEITLDYFGNPMADGGISARAEDLALFGELWRTGGRNREGMRLVPQSWIQTTLTPTPALLDAFARAERPGNRWSTSPYYRNNWWVLDTESRFLAARGYLGQSVHIHGSTGLTVVLLSAWQEHSAERERAVDELVRRLADRLG